MPSTAWESIECCGRNFRWLKDKNVLVAFLIMLREGIEAALIVGIIAGYLKRTGRENALPAVWFGVVLALLICTALGIALDVAGAEFPQKMQETFEGCVALIATAILASMVLWMAKAGRSIKSQLHDSIDAATGSGDRRGLALAAMAFLAVGREGLESVFFLIATVQQDVGVGVPIGAALGILCAFVFGVGMYRGGIRLNLQTFFRWTGVFIIFVAAGLFAGAVRAFHEAGLWNVLQETAFDISGILPGDGLVGTLLAGIFGYQDAPTIAEVVVYLAFLLPALSLFYSQGRPHSVPRTA
jgi:high-affinity iron transporter